MKYFLLPILIFTTISTQAQQAADSSISEEYCIMEVVGVLFSKKVNILVDFGQEQDNWRDRLLKDEVTGKAYRPNSAVEAMNFLGKQGWKLVNAFPVVSSGSSCTQYVFKRAIVNRDNVIKQ